MRKLNVKVAAWLLIGCFATSSCIGSFSLFNKFAKWETQMTKIGRGVFHGGTDVNQLAYSLSDFLVEIYKIVDSPLIEWADIIGIIFKEWTLAIGALKSIPVCAAPLVVVADAQVFHLVSVRQPFYGHCESLQSVGRSDDTAVAVGLFLIGVVLLNDGAVVSVELLIPLYRTEIGCLQYCRFYHIALLSGR